MLLVMIVFMHLVRARGVVRVAAGAAFLGLLFMLGLILAD
jgi:hypothetical protein